jgi:hypothetical protein
MSNDPKRAALARPLGANVEFRWHRLQSAEALNA